MGASECIFSFGLCVYFVGEKPNLVSMFCFGFYRAGRGFKLAWWV